MDLVKRYGVLRLSHKITYHSSNYNAQKMPFPACNRKVLTHDSKRIIPKQVLRINKNLKINTQLNLDNLS